MMQLKWPKYQNPKDEYMRWTKQIFTEFCQRCIKLIVDTPHFQVTQLTIRKAENFKFRCGDWVFVQIPSICYEWHPFTISSAPEQKDVFTLHIRSVGGWTNKLHSYFRKEQRLMWLEDKTNTPPQQGQTFKKSFQKR
jgi:hypothetical protein